MIRGGARASRRDLLLRRTFWRGRGKSVSTVYSKITMDGKNKEKGRFHEELENTGLYHQLEYCRQYIREMQNSDQQEQFSIANNNMYDDDDDG